MNGLSRFAALWLRIITSVFALALWSAARAQTTTTYSYNSLQQLTGASSGNGANTQYQYDANGNLTSIAGTNPSASILNQSVDVALAEPGQSATLSFTATAGETVTLDASSIGTFPSGGTVTFSVYNSSGTLVGSTTGSSNTTLTLSDLPAGNYSLVISPPSGGTADLEVSLQAQSAGSGSIEPAAGDGPLPPWTYVVLALGLIAIMRRYARDKRSSI